MTTLRREIRKKIEEVLIDRFASYIEWGESSGLFASVAEEIADAMNSNNPNFFNDKPKFDVKQADPAWQLFHGETPDNSKLLFEKEAFDTFERDMKTPDNWYWFPAKTSDEKAFKFFREFVIKLYTEDRKAFEKYQTWRTQPYARGAMSNLAIKRNPENFPASWTDFLASSAMYGGKNAQPKPVQTDDKGTPITY
jgi:hypothetical protein